MTPGVVRGFRRCVEAYDRFPLASAASTKSLSRREKRRALMPKDEDYIIALCDKVLGQKAERHKRFPYLIGHKSLKSGRRSRLPVDAFYPKLKLVIEYHERQHIEPVPWWDNKKMCCGCTRGKQR